MKNINKNKRKKQNHRRSTKKKPPLTSLDVFRRCIPVRRSASTLSAASKK
jgi:hypothetical protein